MLVALSRDEREHYSQQKLCHGHREDGRAIWTCVDVRLVRANLVAPTPCVEIGGSPASRPTVSVALVANGIPRYDTQDTGDGFWPLRRNRTEPHELLIQP